MGAGIPPKRELTLQNQIGRGASNASNAIEAISTTLSSVEQGIGSLTSVGVGAAKSDFQRTLLPDPPNNLAGGISALGDIPGPSQFMSLNFSKSNPVMKALTDPILSSQGPFKTLLGSLESISPQSFLSSESLNQFEQFQKTLQTATKEFSDLQAQFMSKIGA
jgi:hypothetical protein